MSGSEHERPFLSRGSRKRKFIPPTRMLLVAGAQYEPFPMDQEIQEKNYTDASLSLALFGAIGIVPESVYLSAERRQKLEEDGEKFSLLVEKRRQELEEDVEEFFLLVESGARLDLKDSVCGYNVLTGAATYGQFEIMFRLLKSEGKRPALNPFWIDGNGEFALHKLAKNHSNQPDGCIDVIEEFLNLCIKKYGLKEKFPESSVADLKKQLLQQKSISKGAKTVIDYAQEKGNQKLVQHLQNEYGLQPSQSYNNERRLEK